MTFDILTLKEFKVNIKIRVMVFIEGLDATVGIILYLLKGYS
jgi:hypothetical protein